MRPDKMLVTTAITLALAAPGLASAAEQEDKVDIVGWAQADLYTEGWTAEQLFDQEVYGDDGEEAGEVENLIVGSDGKLKAIIVESGGILDIGDTHYRVPWDEVQLTPDLEGITVPVTADNIDQYSVFAEDDEDATERPFRATELIDDYVSLSDYPTYGMVQDLVFQNGELTAVVVYPDVGYGVYGPYAYPWYGYRSGWEPGAPAYDLPYDRSEISELGPFDYSRLQAPPPRALPREASERMTDEEAEQG